MMGREYLWDRAATSSDDVSLEGLQEELEECKDDDEIANILCGGTKLREHTKSVENNLLQVELDSIQDYIKESDNLVLLHDQIRDCDNILSQMETLLSGFQAEIGSISSDIKSLQEKSMDMGLKLKNRKTAESKLSKFVEDIIVPPRMIDVIVEGEVNDEYLRNLEILSKKLRLVEEDSMIKGSKALKDVQPELERLRQKAVLKVFEFMVQRLNALRKPKTNIQILQQNVLLKYKYVIVFLKERDKDIHTEVRAAYIDTMNKVLSAHFRVYIQAMEKMQLEIASSTDLIGVDTKSTGIFLRARETIKNRSSVFSLGGRINILKEIDQPALIPHIAEANSQKYPYEVLFRSLHKLLIDTATSEYLFCDDFFGEDSIFYEIFAGPFAVIDEHFNAVLPNCFDAIGVMLMIRIVHQYKNIKEAFTGETIYLLCRNESILPNDCDPAETRGRSNVTGARGRAPLDPTSNGNVTGARGQALDPASTGNVMGMGARGQASLDPASSGFLTGGRGERGVVGRTAAIWARLAGAGALNKDESESEKLGSRERRRKKEGHGRKLQLENADRGLTPAVRVFYN
ncbi:vacuolar protein sorting-associated protein 52 A-like [Phalaenopsis equestris]|uniref:vacuolar protein sorting-associated protein 52 A-like n=1 Tax=Phalaenopsis equestris TaxID=78828 RepID=UPI0009E6322D|nr:vacuolar protein sorting-associated protein 52 A-like [Phalaenopsis equestris]